MIIKVLVFERFRYLTIMYISTRIIHIFGKMSTSGRNDSKTTKVLAVIINVWETWIRRLQQRKIPGKKNRSQKPYFVNSDWQKFGKQRGEPSSDNERKASSEWECFSPASKVGRKKARTWWTKRSKISKRPENSLQTVNVKEHTASGHKKEPKNINKKNC